LNNPFPHKDAPTQTRHRVQIRASDDCMRCCYCRSSFTLFCVFVFVFGVQMSMIWTVPEQQLRLIRCAWSPSSPCRIHSFIKRCASELRPIQFFRPLPFFRFPLPLHMREVRRLPRPSGGPCGGPVAFRDLKFAKERLIFGQICSGFLLRSDPPK